MSNGLRTRRRRTRKKKYRRATAPTSGARRNPPNRLRLQKILPVGFPKTTMVKLRYVDSVYLDPTTSTVAQYVMSANSLFKPQVAIGGHQPMNFDQWAQLYNHYTVVGAKITCTAHSGAVSNADGCFIGVNLQDDTSLSTDPSTILEQGLTRYKFFNQTYAAGAGNGRTVSKTFSAKKFFNITNILDNTGRLGAGVGASPTEQAYFIIMVGPPPTSTVDISSILVTYKIDYICVFAEPKGQPQS